MFEYSRHSWNLGAVAAPNSAGPAHGVDLPEPELRTSAPEEGATARIGLDHLPHVSTVADLARARG